MATKEAMLEKIKRLLALGDASRNNSDDEAKAAMLKAQQLMAKYDISVEEIQDEEEEKVTYSHEECEHKWDYSYRVPLAHVLAKNFRCMVYSRNKKIVFMGHTSDAKICKATFEFAYQFIQRRGNSIYNKRYSMGQTTKGVFNSYARGFINGLQEAFDVQCKALAIVTPQDVVDTFNELTKDWNVKKARNLEATDAESYYTGKKDGKGFMDQKKKLEG